MVGHVVVLVGKPKNERWVNEEDGEYRDVSVGERRGVADGMNVDGVFMTPLGVLVVVSDAF